MVEQFFNLLDIADDVTWSYLSVPAVVIIGIYLSFKSGWIQLFKFRRVSTLFLSFLEKKEPEEFRGIGRLRAFFASIGGCIGIGNVVGVCTAVQIGGPGAVFWMWLTALIGMIVKYSEIYLGMIYRVQNKENSYDGGPMYYLKEVDKSGLLSTLFCILLCVYGIEIYMFRIVTHSVTVGWGLNYSCAVFVLLAAILIAEKGGLDTVGKISLYIVPLFITGYFLISFWAFAHDFTAFTNALNLIFNSAFTGQAAWGAFAGSGILLTISQGVKRACYSGDIGVGYASIIHAESQEQNAEKQASLGIFGVFLDTFVVSSLSVLLIISTDLWNQPIHEAEIVAVALGNHVPYMNIIWPFFIMLLGYSSLIAFFAAGKKSAQYLSPKYGERLYIIYGIFSFLLFSFIGNESHILTIMSVVGAALLIINMYGMFKLRDKISFKL